MSVTRTGARRSARATASPPNPPPTTTTFGTRCVSISPPRLGARGALPAAPPVHADRFADPFECFDADRRREAPRPEQVLDARGRAHGVGVADLACPCEPLHPRRDVDRLPEIVELVADADGER